MTSEAAPGELEAVPSVTAGDVEHARARLELEPLEHEVDLLARPLLGDVQRDLVEPLLLEVAVEPVARDVAQTVRTARSSTIPPSTEVSASTRVERVARALGGVVGEPAGAVDAERDDEAVAVEDVVDDLEEHPELVREGAPRTLLVGRHLGGGERERHRRVEEPPGLQAVHGLEVGVRLHRVEVLAADHAERRLRELARHRRRLVRRREAERLREQRVAGEQRLPLAVRGPDARLAAALGVVVERGQVVVDEREVVDELERRGRGQDVLGLGADRLAGREADDRPDPLAAHLDERVADGLRLAVQLRPELELLEVVLDERLQLVSAPQRPPPASPAPPAPAPPWRSRRARRGRRPPPADPPSPRASRASSSSRFSSSSAFVQRLLGAHVRLSSRRHHAASSRATRPRMPFTSRPASSDA